MSCTHHDPTGRFNYFRHVRTLKAGELGEYVICNQCFSKWMPDSPPADPPAEKVVEKWCNGMANTNETRHAFNQLRSRDGKCPCEREKVVIKPEPEKCLCADSLALMTNVCPVHRVPDKCKHGRDAWCHPCRVENSPRFPIECGQENIERLFRRELLNLLSEAFPEDWVNVHKAIENLQKKYS